MNQKFKKRVPVRLVYYEYQELRERVLRRDRWHCQFCGSIKNLEVHHQQSRSHSGPDTEENLITICVDCHLSIHSGIQ